MSNKLPTVLITGSNGGIGKALVLTFLEAGHKVIATDKASSCAISNKNIYYVPIDLEKFVNNNAYLTSSMNKIKKVLDGQGLNILINNAAVQCLGTVEKLKKINWQQSLDVNLTAPFYLIQELLPRLVQAQGCIINISSIHAQLTKREFVAYATTKAAISGLTRAMAVDLEDKVRVNAIEPAAIETPMLLDGFKDNPGVYKKLKTYHPQKRIGKPEEVAQLALTLANNKFNFLHGACIPLDGGIKGRLYDPVV